MTKKSRVLNFISKYWYLVLAGLFVVAVFTMYIVTGEDSYIAVHDNLDLFIPQYQMMKNTGTFLSHGATVPFLDGISRDYLPSELSLHTIIFMVLPCYYAYIVCYFVKVIIGVISFYLLVQDILAYKNFGAGDGSTSYKKSGAVDETVADKALDNRVKCLIFLAAFGYGILNLFPEFGIPFASIPLVVYILRNIYRKPSWKWYLALFCYPFISYFSYFGLFILGYLVIAIILVWIVDYRKSVAESGRNLKNNANNLSNQKDLKSVHKNGLLSTFPGSLFIGLIVLSIGYVLFEYRLFATMLFSDTVSIRSTMVEANLRAGDIIKEAFDVFVNGMMHADDAHKYAILPICLIYFAFINIRYIVKKNGKGIFHDYFNLCMLLIVFNSIIYALYDSAAVRGLIEAIVPQLKGWQFNRTIFFNPFLWYAAILIVCIRVYRSGKKFAYGISCIVLTLCILVVIAEPSRYNDIYHTAYGNFYTFLHDGQRVDTMNYREFYSEDLFTKIKEDLGYNEGDLAVAYEMYPAQLEYNGISTLDGYLGFYSQQYKDDFREVIAPSLERVPASEAYYDNWAARCYLFSGTDESVQMITKSLTGLTDTDIYIDSAALKSLGCKYIFSRVKISNESEAGLNLIGSYDGEEQAFAVYVYTID